jgi:hypothetical protein
MFYVDTKPQPTYWYAYAGRMEEKMGVPKDNYEYYEFLDYEQAYDFAYNSSMSRKKEIYNELLGRYSSFQMATYKVRAIWNKNVKEGIARHVAKIAAARVDAISVQVDITYLPSTIAFEGARLAIGDTVYIVDTWSMTLKTSTVVEERLRYYGYTFKSVAEYILEDHNIVKATLESGYTNLQFYTDKELVISMMAQLWQGKIAELEQQMKELP